MIYGTLRGPLLLNTDTVWDQIVKSQFGGPYAPTTTSWGNRGRVAEIERKMLCNPRTESRRERIRLQKNVLNWGNEDEGLG